MSEDNKAVEARKMRVEHIAQIYYELSGNDLLPWERCGSRLRTRIRKQVKDFLYATELADKGAGIKFNHNEEVMK